MKEITLTKGRVAVVDDEDFELLSGHKWLLLTCSRENVVYAARSGGKLSHHILMHRVIMRARDGELVDHIDHNGLNNQKSNLRICSKGQNNTNQRIRKDNPSGLKGVTRTSCGTKWRARISFNRKQLFLGVYDSKADAASACDEKARELSGEFALTNAAMRELGIINSNIV